MTGTTTTTDAAKPAANDTRPGADAKRPGGGGAPGNQQQRRRRPRSRYGVQMHEKQTLKGVYGVREEQLRVYYRKARGGAEQTGTRLIQLLEQRLDNAVYRAGFAETRPQARQLVSHKYFLVNDRAVNISSFNVSEGDVITLKTNKREKAPFANFSKRAQNIAVPSWLALDGEAFSFTVTAQPNVEEAAVGVDMRAIIEFFAR